MVTFEATPTDTVTYPELERKVLCKLTGNPCIGCYCYYYNITTIGCPYQTIVYIRR